jgi:transcriptional regulator with XRE-family HTH domain
MLDYKAIGRRIAYYRKKNFLTQEKLAEQLGFSESYMSQVECGKVKLSLQRLDQISEILNVNIVLLISDADLNKDDYGDSEFIEIIRDWSPKQKNLLLALLQIADTQINHDKKSDSQKKL